MCCRLGTRSSPPNHALRTSMPKDLWNKKGRKRKKKDLVFKYYLSHIDIYLATRERHVQAAAAGCDHRGGLGSRGDDLGDGRERDLWSSWP